ncbi:hypothetical protein ACA910_002063 [Epithemia clementina (nom. ined.)]
MQKQQNQWQLGTASASLVTGVLSVAAAAAHVALPPLLVGTSMAAALLLGRTASMNRNETNNNNIKTKHASPTARTGGSSFPADRRQRKSGSQTIRLKSTTQTKTNQSAAKIEQCNAAMIQWANRVLSLHGVLVSVLKITQTLRDVALRLERTRQWEQSNVLGGIDARGRNPRDQTKRPSYNDDSVIKELQRERIPNRLTLLRPLSESTTAAATTAAVASGDSKKRMSTKLPQTETAATTLELLRKTVNNNNCCVKTGKTTAVNSTTQTQQQNRARLEAASSQARTQSARRKQQELNQKDQQQQSINQKKQAHAPKQCQQPPLQRKTGQQPPCQPSSSLSWLPQKPQNHPSNGDNNSSTPSRRMGFWSRSGSVALHTTSSSLLSTTTASMWGRWRLGRCIDCVGAFHFGLYSSVTQGWESL